MATMDTIGGGNIEPRGLEEEMRSAYLDYAMSVIVGRALPDVRDGLKPVHRRVLYVMNELGLQPTRKHVKCAQIVGEVMGKYHPHGDSAIYDTLVRLAQDFSMRYPLVDGHGNFGNIDGYSAAAMRYTEARLASLAREMLRDIDAETVDFVPTYDGSRQEPVVLPARFPNLLVNGGSGIAVGMATNIPPHNLREVVAATIAYIDNPAIDVEALMRHIKGPDFPTAGTILGRDGIREAYATGRGRVRVQAKAHIEPIGQGKEAIIVTELPYQVRKGGEGGLILKIRDLVLDKKVPEITDLRDESDRHGMRIVIELKRDAIPKVVLNKLYKHTPMQTTFGVNMVALVDNVPQTLSLREVIGHYVDHQREIVVRRTKYELRRAEERAHVLEGLLIALDNLDEVIELIRGSADPEAARAGLLERFELTVVQAQAILQLTLSRLTALEADKIKSEHADLVERIEELREILGDEDRVYGLIKDELREISDAYGDERRTEIIHAEGEIDIEDLIADQQMVISITHSGYVKSLPLSTYRQQRRGGLGVAGMDMKEDDYIEHLFVSSTHDYLLFFTNRGKVYRLKVYELPEASRTAKGRALVNLLPLREGERVQSVLATRDFSEGRYLVFATRDGLIKKTEFGAYNTPIKADGIIAINIRDDDELIAVRRTSGHDDIIMVSRSGQAARFGESQVRAMGRDTSGVHGMNVAQKGNSLLAMDVARDDQELLVVTENGYGKRTPIPDYPVKGRATMGVKTITLTENKGQLAGALVVREHQELVFISQNGMVQRTSVRGINRYGRASQGVRLMNLREDDQVSAVALVIESEAQTAAQVIDVDAAPLEDEGSPGNGGGPESDGDE
jgi:DNA gyrase subunit A